MTGHSDRARGSRPPRLPVTIRSRRPARDSERLRRPQPLFKRRMPSGRGAMEQPNITSGGAGVLTPRFWLMVVLTGVAAGLLGALMMLILFNVQYAAFGYHAGSLEHGVAQASAARRVGSLLIAGAFGGVAWFLLRRYLKGKPSEIDEALWNGDGRLSFPRSLGSLGDLRGGHRHGRVDRTGGRTQAARRRVGQRPVRVGGPVGGAAPAGRGVRRRRRARRRLQRPARRRPVHRRNPHREHHPARHAAGHRCARAIATATAWIYLPNRAVYPGIPDYRFTMVPDDLGAAGGAGHRADLRPATSGSSDGCRITVPGGPGCCSRR